MRLPNGRWFLNDLSSKATDGRVLILPRPSRNPSGAIGENRNVTTYTGFQLIKAAADLGLEGIVSKQATSLYRGGRSKNWLKNLEHGRERIRPSWH